MNAPCKNCPKRTVSPDCHGICPDYLAYNDERERIRQARFDARQSAPEFHGNDRLVLLKRRYYKRREKGAR